MQKAMLWITRQIRRNLVLIASFASLFYTFYSAYAKTSAPSLGSASSFAVLAGTAVTCTNTPVTGNVGVWPGTAITETGCTVAGTVHTADAVAKKAFMDFMSAYNVLAPLNNTCDSVHTLTGTLNGLFLSPGVYCVDAVAKAGTLILDGQHQANPVWIFLVNGALTGTGFNVILLNGGQPCNVFWWVKDAATLTTSNVQGVILAGAAITVTGGTLSGDVLATAAVTLTGTKINVCQATGGTVPPPPGKCVQEDDDKDKDKDKDHDKKCSDEDDKHNKCTQEKDDH
jgi:hypothetical protein